MDLVIWFALVTFFTLYFEGYFDKKESSPRAISPRPRIHRIAPKAKVKKIGFKIHINLLKGIEESKCEFCGCKFTDNVIFCPACQTPHHADCWEESVQRMVVSVRVRVLKGG